MLMHCHGAYTLKLVQQPHKYQVIPLKLHYRKPNRKTRLSSKSSQPYRHHHKSLKENRRPLLRFHQLWLQFSIVDGVACRKYSPGPSNNVITVPVVPDHMQKSFCNSAIMIHQPATKVLTKYWNV